MYLSSVMGTTALSVFITVIILHLHHKTFTKPVPMWLLRLLLIKPNSVMETTRQANGPRKVANNTLQSNGILEQYVKTFESMENEPKDYSRSPCHVNCDHVWKTVVRRIDRGLFLIFVLIFSMLLLVVTYPYKRSVTLESGRCDDN